MDIHIDWLSFTLPCAAAINNVSDLYLVSKGLLKQIGEQHRDYIFDGTGFDQTVGRPPYRYALARDDNGCRVFGGGVHPTVLYEMSGRACEGIREYHDVAGFCAPIAENVTRLDIACDVLTETRPAMFANDRTHQSFRSISYIRSDTGETVYVGSPKSDRFARVYRYNHPHPRSALLRIEFVFRRGLAKTALKRLLESGSYAAFSSEAGNTWGWNHPDWRPDIVTSEKLRVPVVVRENEDTVRWLYTQVAPALRRLLKEDAINIADFLEFVYGQGED